MKEEEFIKKYEELCKEYSMYVAWADETGYFLQTKKLYFFSGDIGIQVASLKSNEEKFK